MVKGSWSRCSSLLLAFVLLTALAVPVTAVTVGGADVPEEAAVGSQISATVTLTDLYREPQLERWEIQGSTQLTNVTWTVQYFDQTGSKVDQESFAGQQFSGAVVSTDEGISEVQITVTGTVPQIREFTYDPPEEFRTMRLTQAQQGGASTEIRTWSTHHYTPTSQSARTSLDDARAAIDAASNADTSEAEETFTAAVDAYNNGNFDNAERLASRAQQQAQSAQQSARTRQLVIYAVAGLLVLGALVGGFLYWRSQQETYDRLG